MVKTKTIAVVLACLLHATRIYAQHDGYIYLSLGPHVSFTQNISADYGYGKPSEPGPGYSGLAGYGYRFKYGFFTEIGLGYYSLQQSISVTPLYMHLSQGILSYRVNYIQGVLTIGHQLPIASAKFGISPFSGVRFLSYLSSGRHGNDDWQNVDLAPFQSNDIVTAHYRQYETGHALSAFILHIGIDANCKISGKLSAIANIFWDSGFKTLQADGFRSEELYRHNTDYYYSMSSSNKGDAVGLNIGLQYHFVK